MLFNLVEINLLIVSLTFTSIIIVAFTEYIKRFIGKDHQKIIVFIISVIISIISGSMWKLPEMKILQLISFYIFWFISLMCVSTLFYDILLKSLKDFIEITLENIRNKSKIKHIK